MAEAELQSTPYPDAVRQAWRFALFNGLSYQIVGGSPMILYVKTLHASATVLGIITGMMPLLVILQIPAAEHIPRLGLKRFFIGGWGTRTLFTFGLAAVPFLAVFLDAPTRLVLVLALLFGFNFVRGVTSCGWLPWITALVPETLRGRYLARDAAMTSLGCFVTVLVCAATLGTAPHAWQFAATFAFSATMGLTSLVFLRRMPDVPVADDPARGRGGVPWGEMLRHPPFRKLLRAVMAWALAAGGVTTFTVTFLKSETGLPEGKILLLTSVFFLGGLSSLWFLGHRLDQLGSKPVLKFSVAMWLLVMAGWAAIAGGLLAPELALILALQFLMGLFTALVNAANSRLAMAVIPVMGRNHFFALYSVFANVTQGLAPIAWGLLIDAIGHRHWTGLGLDWNRYTIFFAAVAAAFGVMYTQLRGLEEPQAASLEKLLAEVFVQSPQRLWLRLWAD
jgi:MFS family permease